LKGFELIRKRLLGLILATVGTVACMATVSTASAFAELKGAGSTLVAPLMGQWANGWEARTNGAVKVVYAAVGSGSGIAQITARTVDFGASDAPLTPEQAAACNNCVQIPWALTGVGIGYNIPGVKKGKLRMSGPVLAGIYMGKISKWNDPKIKKLNPKLHLPAMPITPVFRSDGSGDTYAFTNYLSKISPAWKSSIGYATSVGFPAGVGGHGNSGVTSVVSTTKGSIGYITATYIVAAGLGAAAVENSAGKFEFPNLNNIEAAAQTVKHVPANNELHIVDPSKKAKTAYPISTFTYCIVPHGSPKKAELEPFIKYNLTIGQKYGAALDFAPLPKVVFRAGERAAGSI
jgi:phosphate transport system substrate-binding protein